MHTHRENSHNADVIAVFDNQDDVDEAILQLRLNGFKDRDIGCFVMHPTAGVIDLTDRSYAGMGVVLGTIVGAALGLGWALYLNGWSIASHDVNDFFGLIATCVTCAALTAASIGWWIGVEVHRTGVVAPRVDPRAGAYVLAVHTGAPERAWALIHDKGGHELPPGALMARPAAV
jgi:hypothetical protein